MEDHDSSERRRDAEIPMDRTFEIMRKPIGEPRGTKAPTGKIKLGEKDVFYKNAWNKTEASREWELTNAWANKHPEHSARPIGGVQREQHHWLLFEWLHSGMQAEEYLDELAESSKTQSRRKDWLAERRMKLAALVGEAIGKAHHAGFASGDMGFHQPLD